MNTANAMKSNSYDRFIELGQVDKAANADGSPTIIGIDAQSVAGPFMPRKPAFSTAC